VTLGGPGTVFQVVRHGASSIDLLKGYKCSRPDLKQSHFTWLDSGETRDIYAGDYVALCDPHPVTLLSGERTFLWCFYHVLYQKKFVIEPGNYWYGVFEHFMKALDDKRK
jgi:hypothetical protein